MPGITRKALPRRTVLRGLGVTMALPLLDCMVPALSALHRTPAAPRRRFGFVYVPHGSIVREWTPAQEGRHADLSPILTPLAPFRHRLTVFTNLSIAGEPGHAVSSAMWLSGARPAMDTPRVGVTIDQIIARRIGRESRFASIELGTESHAGHPGGCAGDVLCSYMGAISWASATEPRPPETDPRAAFRRLFGCGRAPHAGVLDAVLDSASDLKARLGASDRLRLTEYFDHIDDVERRLVSLDRPDGNWEEHATLQFDLMALALQADATRVVSFMMARELSTRSYPQVGVADGHHRVSHNSGLPGHVRDKVAVDTCHVELFARFLEKLRSTPDGDGSLFDQSLFLYGSGMSDGNAHDHRNLPALIVGGGGGAHAGHGHVTMSRCTPLSNLLVSMAGVAGIDLGAFGQSDGAIPL